MRLVEFFPPDGIGFEDPTIGNVAGGFSAAFAVVLVIALVIIGFGVFVGVRKYTLLKRAGHDPLTVDAALAAKLLDSDTLRPAAAAGPAGPARTIEQRLAEVDDLHARGVISPEERTAARAAILGG